MEIIKNIKNMKNIKIMKNIQNVGREGRLGKTPRQRIAQGKPQLDWLHRLQTPYNLAADPLPLLLS